MRGNEVRAFWGACNGEAKKIAADLRSKDPDAVAERRDRAQHTQGHCRCRDRTRRRRGGEVREDFRAARRHECSLILDLL